MTARLSPARDVRTVTAVLVTVALAATTGQTRITPPESRYSVADDVKLGQQAAAEVRKELPLLADARIDGYIDRIGARLVAAIPSEFRHPEFTYTFDVINQKEINAFALPGGPMFLNRGMIEAATTEAEMAGVMAHEISHVALRHGTASATRSTLPQAVSVAGQLLGAIFGGTAGAAVGLGSQIGATAWATKYSREFESQSDLLGAQILARAGYDPREMANMFKTIEAQGGGGGPEWLSSHPNPGNRYAAILKEAESLSVQGRADTSEFAGIQTRLREAGPSYTAEQIAKGQATARGDTAGAGGGGAAVRVEPPSAQTRTLTPASFLRVTLPANWTQISGSEALTYSPRGGYVQSARGTAFTHGVQFGVAQSSGNLQRDTQALLDSFARSNPNLRQRTSLRRDTLGGRQALSTTLTNVSDVSGQPEFVTLWTVTLPDGRLLYMIGVAPESESRTYDAAFQRVKQSIRLR